MKESRLDHDREAWARVSGGDPGADAQDRDSLPAATGNRLPAAGEAWKLRGEESGGAVELLGHYVGFVDGSGKGIALAAAGPEFPSQRSARGSHCDEFVRVEMFRFENTYDLLITNTGSNAQEGKRPEMRSSILFLGRNGSLETELWGKDAAFRGGAMPHFFTRSGEAGIARIGMDRCHAQGDRGGLLYRLPP